MDTRNYGKRIPFQPNTTNIPSLEMNPEEKNGLSQSQITSGNIKEVFAKLKAQC